MQLPKRVRITWKESPGPPEVFQAFFKEVRRKALTLRAQGKTDGFILSSPESLTIWRCFADESSATEWLDFFVDLVNQSTDDVKQKFDSIIVEDNNVSLPEKDGIIMWDMNIPQ